MLLLQLSPPTREKQTMWRQLQTTTTQVWTDEETTTFQELFSPNKQQHHVRRKQQPDAVMYPELPNCGIWLKKMAPPTMFLRIPPCIHILFKMWDTWLMEGQRSSAYSSSFQRFSYMLMYQNTAVLFRTAKCFRTQKVPCCFETQHPTFIKPDIQVK